MALARGHTQEDAIAWFGDHVSSGKAAFLTQYGMEFVPCQREGIHIWDASGFQRVLQFLRPLIMDDLEAEEALAALDRALATQSKLRGWHIIH